MAGRIDAAGAKMTINLTIAAALALVAPDAEEIPRAVERYELTATPAQMIKHRPCRPWCERRANQSRSA